VEINFAEILKTLKDFAGFRFYFIIIIIVIGFGLFYFENEIKANLNKEEEIQIRFREVRNLKGLEISLDLIQEKYDFIEGYGVYIYQPIEKSFYKKIIITNSDLIKSISSLQGIYLDTQSSLNDLLLKNDAVILDVKSLPLNNDLFFYQVGISNLLIKRLTENGVLIGEIHFILNRDIEEREMRLLLNDVIPLKYIYIL